ncbi:hypothetical protein J2R76_002034 [Bradyrhizobium sp. USDA 4532]|uniref:Uncharacterized protein n=1 Tax=Bradyrhizobium brasilense TaxID=1419277 RepID=A0ABY8JA93_9BRAD|nr:MULTISPECIES: hypothetical protein [Bradyrhizobium]MCP1833699.1 hypothetical protein [Bradyrhizobium sp. USDA 4545]MCP1852625.1 hypothetical protein [Bradyrhizobium sp. USDA 4541]MCP1918443.1 hypothetical protein [Bradyrhizobium sp. USDA 4532]WFU60918.1 hypothetical protein QA636_25615 [Bradyrhizobium brasilense]
MKPIGDFNRSARAEPVLDIGLAAERKIDRIAAELQPGLAVRIADRRQDVGIVALGPETTHRRHSGQALNLRRTKPEQRRGPPIDRKAQGAAEQRLGVPARRNQNALGLDAPRSRPDRDAGAAFRNPQRGFVDDPGAGALRRDRLRATSVVSLRPM